MIFLSNVKPLGTGLTVHFSDMDDLIFCETALDARGSKVGTDG